MPQEGENERWGLFLWYKSHECSLCPKWLTANQEKIYDIGGIPNQNSLYGSKRGIFGESININRPYETLDISSFPTTVCKTKALQIPGHWDLENPKKKMSIEF